MNAKFRSRRYKSYLAVVVLATVLPSAAIGYFLSESYRSAVANAQSACENLAQLVEFHLTPILSRTAAILEIQAREVPFEYLQKSAVEKRKSDVSTRMRRLLKDFPDISGTYYFDAQGDLLYTSDFAAKAANVADRLFFKVLLGNPQVSLFFSDALVARTTGRWSIVIAQGVRDETGQFMGVTTALLDLEENSESFGSLNLGRSGVIQIRRTDDTHLMLRVPFLASEMNRPAAADAPIHRILQTGQTTASFRYASPADGIERLASVRALPSYPFYIQVDIARSEYLSDWYGQVIAALLGSAAFASTLAIFTVRLRRIEKREEETGQRLLASEERYRLLFSQAKLPMLLIDPNTGDIVEANAEACQYYGYTRERLLALPISAINTLSPKEIAGEMKLAETQRRNHFRFRHRLSNGEIREVQVHSGPVELDGKKKLFTVVVDVTDRVVAEQAFKELNQSLVERIQEETRKNREKDHLIIQQSRLAAMGEMIGNIAHQWRQPLNAVALVLGNIEDAFKRAELNREYLDNLVRDGERQIEKMSSTIDDFRNYFRPQKQPEPFSMIDAIEGALSLVSASFVSHRIELQADMDEDAQVVGFANEFSQVLLNLLNNAKDAILSCGRTDGKIGIRLYKEGSVAKVVVSDNGGGVPARDLEKIFEPYFSTKEMGTGIGLYMSKMIVEQNMRGSIVVHNVNSGAQFTVTCPLDAYPRPAGAPARHDLTL